MHLELYSRGYTFLRTAITKCHKLGDLNQQILILSVLEPAGWKPKCQQGQASAENLGRSLPPLPSFQCTPQPASASLGWQLHPSRLCLCLHRAFCVCVCVCLFSFLYKDTSDIRVGSTLMKSFNLITSVKTLSPNK